MRARRGSLIRRARSAVVLTALVCLALAVPAGAGAPAAAPDLVVMTPGATWRVPEAEAWRVPFAVFTAGEAAGWEVEVVGVALDGRPLAFGEGMCSHPAPIAVAAAGPLTNADLCTIAALRPQVDRGRDLSTAEAQLWRHAYPRWRDYVLSHPGLPQGWIEVEGSPDQGPGHYELRVDLVARRGAQEQQLSFSSDLQVRTIGSLGSWVPGDLHLHSTYSDGWNAISTLVDWWEDAGYDFIYMTDHAEQFASQFAAYAADCRSGSNPGCQAFPGCEVATQVGGAHRGHMLAYGISSLSGLTTNPPPQTAIDTANANNPSAPSSAAIAHPKHLILGWEDWTVQRHRGMEIMSGIQTNFGLTSGPLELLRDEIVRLMPSTFLYGCLPSPRTGSDYHTWLIDSPRYMTWVYVGDGYASDSYDGKKSRVDQALYAGRTVAGRYGSVVLLTINGNGPGTVLDGVGTGTMLNFTVTVRPDINGYYRIRVFRGDMTETLYDQWPYLYGGQTYQWTFSRSFGGGDQYFWACINDNDDVYTSPIYLSSHCY